MIWRRAIQREQTTADVAENNCMKDHTATWHLQMLVWLGKIDAWHRGRRLPWRICNELVLFVTSERCMQVCAILVRSLLFLTSDLMCGRHVTYFPHYLVWMEEPIISIEWIYRRWHNISIIMDVFDYDLLVAITCRSHTSTLVFDPRSFLPRI